MKVKIKESEIKDPTFFSSRGVEKFNQKDFEAAIEDFNKAIDLDQESPDFYNLRGHARYESGDVKGARLDFKRSKKLKTKTKKKRKTSK